MGAHCLVQDAEGVPFFLITAITNLELTCEQFDPHSITFTQYRKKVYGD